MKRNVPKLRFKGFEDEWEEKTLGNVLDFYTTNSLSRECLNNESGEIKNIHYGDIHMKFPTILDCNNWSIPFINEDIDISKIKEESFCKDGDIIIADASEDYDDIGKAIEINNINDTRIVAGLHTILARDNKGLTVNGFKGYMLSYESVRKQIKILAAGAKVLGISKTNLAKVKVKLPSLQEQEKIANFLSKVDSYIEEQGGKVNDLELYKKGMMQKIFSQEIRFKDENGCEYPAWQEKNINSIAEFRNGKAHENSICDNGNYIVINSKFISTEGIIKKYSDKEFCPLQRGDITIVMSDVPNGKALAKTFLVDDNDLYTLNQRVGCLRCNYDNSQFINYSINRNTYFLKFDNGVGQTNLKKNEILECPILLPCLEEQTKIANFLSNIDAIIEEEKNKLEDLRQWKKGLLQQMFV